METAAWLAQGTYVCPIPHRAARQWQNRRHLADPRVHDVYCGWMHGQ